MAPSASVVNPASPAASTAGGMAPSRAQTDRTMLGFAALTYTVLWPALWMTGQVAGVAQHASLAALLSATLALLTWNRCAGTSYARWRTWVLAAYQLASPVVMMVGEFTLQLDSPPSPGFLGCLASAIRVLTGCRVHMLLFLGAGLPLDVLPQMAVQAASVGSIILLRQDCHTPLLDTALMETRFRSLHSYMALTTMGLFPYGLPLGGRQQQCAAALDFILVLLGWVLPIYFVARASYPAAAAAAALQTRDRAVAAAAAAQAAAAQGQTQGQLQGQGQGQVPAAVGQVVQRRDHHQQQQQQQQQGWGGEPLPLPSIPAAAGAGAGVGLTRSQRMAVWLMRDAFQQGGAASERFKCWLSLGIMSWLVALLTSAAASAWAGQ